MFVVNADGRICGQDATSPSAENGTNIELGRTFFRQGADSNEGIIGTRLGNPCAQSFDGFAEGVAERQRDHRGHTGRTIDLNSAEEDSSGKSDAG